MQRKFVVAGASLTLALVAFASAHAGEIGYVTGSSVNCREEGSATSKIVKVLNRGDRAMIVDRVAGWANLDLGEEACWVLAKYVGVYSGLYQGNRRTVEVTLSGGELIATLVSDEALKVARPPAVPRTLVRQSQTLFEGLGLGYQFVVDDKGVATAVVEIHVSGPYKYARQR